MLIQVKSGDVNPDFSLLSDILYENPLESQFWMLFDEHKQHLLSGDAYTQRVSNSILCLEVLVL